MGIHDIFGDHDVATARARTSTFPTPKAAKESWEWMAGATSGTTRALLPLGIANHG